MTNPYVPARIAVVTTEPGFGDHSMADQVLTGLEDLASDIVVDYEYFIATDQSDAQSILETNSTSGVYDLIVVIGGELIDELQTVAASNPNQKYAFIGGEVVADNVYSTSFREYQGAFLAGALAAMTSVGNENRTGTSIIGIIGSVEADPVVASLIAGFKQGVEYTNTTYNLTVTLLPEEYVDSYNDSTEAESLATDMFNPEDGNATILFTPVRASILGIRAAMLYANQTWYGNTTRQPLTIAAEGDQDYLGLPDINTRVGTSWIITSVVPRSDLAVYDVINSTLWGEFEGADLVYDLEKAGNDYTTPGVILTHSEFINYEWVPQSMFDIINSLKQSIINGTIVVSPTYP